MNALHRMHFLPRIAAENRAQKFWPALAAIVLGISLARWAWILFAPATMAVLPPSEITVSEDAEKLFGVASSSTSGLSTVVLPGARLVGVFAPTTHSAASTSRKQTGFAIFQLDEKHQAGAALGGEVAPGVKLHEIYADHVILERDGVTQLVRLEGLPPNDNQAKQPAPNSTALSAEQRPATVPARAPDINPAAGMARAPAATPAPQPLHEPGFQGAR